MIPSALILGRHEVTIRAASAQEQLVEQQRLQSRGGVSSAIEWAWNYLADRVYSLAARFFGVHAILVRHSDKDPFLSTMRIGGRVVHLSKHPHVIDAIPRDHTLLCMPEGNYIERTYKEFLPQYTFHAEDMVMLCGQETRMRHHALLQSFSKQQITPATIRPFIENTIWQWEREARGRECNPSCAAQGYTCGFLTQFLLGPTSISHEFHWAIGILLARLENHTVAARDLYSARNILGGVMARALSFSSPDARHPTLIRVMREQGCSNERIVAMIISLFMAGQMASSASLTYTLLKCAQDPDLQASILRHIAEGEHQGFSFKEAILYAPILQQVIAESVRMMTPVVEIRRAVKADTVVSVRGSHLPIPHRYYLRAGSEICLLPGELARNSLLFGNDANTFRPSRHDAARASLLPELEWRPFGARPHCCPGWTFFQLGMAWLVAELLRNYRLSTSFVGEPKQYCAHTTNGIKDDPFIRLAPR